MEVYMSIYGLKSILQVPERIIFGTGTISELGGLIEEFGKKVLLIYGGRSLMESGTHARVTHLLAEHGIAVFTKGGISHDPDELQVKEAVDLALERRPDVIVGIGGGSVIDAAKAASIIATNGGGVRDYWEGKAFTKPSIPYIAVPTTSGTGAEITKNAVISGRDRTFKKSIRSTLMIPNRALVDPELTVHMPADVTVNTGLDALIQNLEAYVSKNAGPITDTLAHEAIELSARYLLRAVEKPDDLDAREALALTSLYGGITLANAGLGLAHGLAHPLGIRYTIPHGRACALTLAKVIEYNYGARKRKYDEIAKLLGSNSKDAAAAFTQFIEKLGVSTKLSEYGVKQKDIPALVEGSKGGSRRYNPVDHDDETVAKILEELL
jgi:alcohol dehydrogenase class IV